MTILTKSQKKALRDSRENRALSQAVVDSGYSITKDRAVPETLGVQVYREARNSAGDLIAVHMMITPRGKIFNATLSRIGAETVAKLVEG